MKPNILFIVTDQEYAHLELPDGVVLPNHRRLKDRGVTFTNYQVTTTLCTPSRACMYTGQHTPNNGMIDNTNVSYIGAMDSSIPTMGHIFREEGYYTAYKGKWHLGRLSYETTSVDELEPYGFSDFQTTGDTHGLVNEGAWRDAHIAKEASMWLHDHKDLEQPWLLAINFLNPHDIMFFNTGDGHSLGRMNVARQPVNNPLYEQKWDVTLPPSFADDGTEQPAAVEGYKQAARPMYGEIPVEREDLWLEHINYYINCMIDVDRHLGTVLDALEASGQLENTIIVYTSDHGEMAGAHQLSQKGMVVFRELVNVPLIVVHPNGQQGQITEAVGSSVDLLPTMLAWAGASVEKHSQLVGRSLAPLIFDAYQVGPRGDNKTRGDGALLTFDMLMSYDRPWFMRILPYVLEIDGDGQRRSSNANYVRSYDELFEKHGMPRPQRHMLRGVFDGRFKFIRYFAINNYNKPTSMEALLANNDIALYDLVNDPHEMVNLATQAHENLILEMNAKLNRLISTEIGDDQSPYGL